YATPLPPARQLTQVAVKDIGAVAVRLLEDPGRFAGRRFDLGSDELTGNDVLAILSRVTGRPFTYFQIPLDVIRQRMGEDGVKMAEWLHRGGCTVAPPARPRALPRVAVPPPPALSPTSPSRAWRGGRGRRTGTPPSRAHRTTAPLTEGEPAMN